MRFSLSFASVVLASLAVLTAAPATALDASGTESIMKRAPAAIAHANHRRQTSGAKSYCTPKQACWPSANDWSAFNSTVGGRLVKVVPWADPCFPKPNGVRNAECNAVKSSYMSGLARADQIGIAQSENWAYCYSNEGDAAECQLNQLNPFLSVTLLSECKLGRISPYAVAVSSAEDVQKTIAFAKQRNIKVVIKNTGHEYLGRSTLPDTLMIWTHKLKSINYVTNWSGTGNDVLVLGAGVQAGEAYKAAADRNKAITLGAVRSVGIAGGFAMGGGHGPYGPKYGMGVDNILQYTIVTADGQIRTANANTNNDLYWALRGGGGGSWGVVTEVVYKLHPGTPLIVSQFNLTFNLHLVNGDNDKNIVYFLEAMAENEGEWRKQGWAGYSFVFENYIQFNYVVPSGDMAAAKAVMQPFYDKIRANKAWTLKDYKFEMYPSVADMPKFLVPTETPVPVGFSERLAGRLMPVSSFATNTSRRAMAKALTKAFRLNSPTISVQGVANLVQPVPLQIYSTFPKPAAWGGPSGTDTSLHPAWRDSLWTTVIAIGWTSGFPQFLKDNFAKNVHDANQPLRDISNACYYSEADALEENWQEVFWGSNYARLLSIKQKYDPDKIFTVFKGVGYTPQVAGEDAFRCYQKA